MVTVPELLLPDQFSVTVTPADYQFAESKFYAGNISRLSLTQIPKAGVATITIRPLTYSYFVQLQTFFQTVRQSQNFKVNRAKLIARNPTITSLLPFDRLFFFRDPIKIDDSKIGRNGTLQSLTIVLRESFQLTPVVAVVIPSAKSTVAVQKIGYANII